MVSAVWPGQNWKLMEVKDVEVMWLAGQEVGLEHYLAFQLLVVTTGSREDLSEHFACARCLFWQEGSGVKRGRAKPLTCWTWCCLLPRFDLTSCPGISPSLQGILVWMTNNAAIINSNGVTVNKPVNKAIKYRLADSNCRGEKTNPKVGSGCAN